MRVFVGFEEIRGVVWVFCEMEDAEGSGVRVHRTNLEVGLDEALLVRGDALLGFDGVEERREARAKRGRERERVCAGVGFLFIFLFFYKKYFYFFCKKYFYLINYFNIFNDTWRPDIVHMGATSSLNWKLNGLTNGCMRLSQNLHFRYDSETKKTLCTKC